MIKLLAGRNLGLLLRALFSFLALTPNPCSLEILNPKPCSLEVRNPHRNHRKPSRPKPRDFQNPKEPRDSHHMIAGFRAVQGLGIP